MRKLLTCTLLALAALLVSCSSEPKEWYADVTEWITGLPMDNTCATSRAAYLAAGSALSCLTHTLLPTPGMSSSA